MPSVNTALSHLEAELAAYRIQCEPAAFDPEPFDICHSHGRQCGYIDEAPGRLVANFDGLPTSAAQHDAHLVTADDAGFAVEADSCMAPVLTRRCYSSLAAHAATNQD